MNSLASLNLFRYYELLKDEQIILSYSGALDGDLIDMIIQLADRKLENCCTRLRVKKKIINILIESLQNVLNYAIENADNTKLTESPFLVLIEREDAHIILVGNYVMRDRADFLRNRLTSFDALSDDELHDYYIKSLNKEELPDHGGAGLGLVDIMRRSRHNLKFELTPIDEIYELFCLQIRINH